MSTNYIKPQLSAGFRDYLPKDQIPRQKIIKTIQNVFESFGFVPLKTPAIERKINLTGGKDLDMEIFKAKLEGSPKELALRFDLTVPLARVISANPKLEKPFKRYQVGRVWRGERPQDGRYREFLQFDADIIGTKSLMADSEIVAVMFETMKALGVNNFLIKLNNRKILNGLSQYIGFDKKKTKDVLRIIDKKDKKSWPELEQEFKKEVNLSNDQIKKIKEFISIKPGKEELLNKVKKLMAQSKQALVGVGELLQITKNLKALGVDDKNWDIDLSVARGLGYY
ncbi:MAG TPA: HisS family protein, partial [Patescibacteria group bacterium]|nr:HisS family protein [Patescibacteria group bacterium]